MPWLSIAEYNCGHFTLFSKMKNGTRNACNPVTPVTTEMHALTMAIRTKVYPWCTYVGDVVGKKAYPGPTKSEKSKL